MRQADLEEVIVGSHSLLVAVVHSAMRAGEVTVVAVLSRHVAGLGGAVEGCWLVGRSMLVAALCL